MSFEVILGSVAKKSRPRKRLWARFGKGFTLIELLVVVSIIALLVSILMPALGKARQQARKVMCLANLKHQMAACQMYLDDSKGIFPTVSYPGWGGIKIQGAMNRYVGINTKKPSDIGSTTAFQALEVFRCPSDRGCKPGDWNLTMESFWDFWGCSYKYNDDANNGSSNFDGQGLFGKPMSKIKHPAWVIVVHDYPFATYWANGHPWLYYYWHHETELGWSNVAFADFSARYLQAERDNPDWQHGPNWTFIYTGSLVPTVPGVSPVGGGAGG
jgi:prepilin-type N-terminal cleavage/methylation domain-containing protein